MALSLRNMIAILVTIFILLGVFFVASLYYPTNKQAKRIARSLAILEAQVEDASPVDGPAKRTNEILEVMGEDVNFFKRRNLSPTKGIPDLLEKINRIGSEANIEFVVVKPLEEDDTSEYRQYPILIEIKAGYTELVNFVHQMEDSLHLSLKDFRIENEKKDGSMHRLYFTLNIFELKDELPVAQGESSEKQIFRSVARDLVAVRRDPFSPGKQPRVVQVPKKPLEKMEKKEEAPAKPARPKLILTGIANLDERGFVIINGKILRVGDTIEGQRVEQIEDGHVIILDGNSAYPLYLEGSKPFELIEIGGQSPLYQSP
ncbi:MAG: type 4a pilus biogenesis protein PilO [Proteobacteria bacterium]|nr:type 4a pilus biogenesis protein PilO [Pseudomonadota bacterium]NIS68394.1 type 4a pilus biogenesis protein PilO [Pseudomonadota bacterium]